MRSKFELHEKKILKNESSLTPTPTDQDSDSAHILRFDSAHEYYRTVEYELERTSGAPASLDFIF